MAAGTENKNSFNVSVESLLFTSLTSHLRITTASFLQARLYLASKLRCTSYLPVQVPALAHPKTTSAAAAAMAISDENPAGSAAEAPSPAPQTRILPVNVEDIAFTHSVPGSFLHSWRLELNDSTSARNLRLAAQALQERTFPVAFPTETVYGLGADATSSQAVRGIYTAKQRPTDNPLIVHFASLEQLRNLLQEEQDGGSEPIPPIYQPLIRRFWPGPLTLLLPLPRHSPLAPEVTNSLATFGARMPSSKLALALIQATGTPLAAPSANASGRPSPTTAQHVLEDLDGRISLILDGGACDVGVESTVVDGLCDPPCVLRPGGVGIDAIRMVPGWERVVGLWQSSESSHEAPETSCPANGHSSANGVAGGKPNDAPRAPGMKYRHYAPRAHVVLVDAPAWYRLEALVVSAHAAGRRKVGILRTGSAEGKSLNRLSTEEIALGPSVKHVARGLFAALRELDRREVDVIFVEGLPLDSDKTEDNEAEEAVMNRLRKAAGERIAA